MRLSELQHLIDTMRNKATTMGIADPNVEFWMTAEQAKCGNFLRNFQPHPSAAAEISDHVVQISGTAAQRGDFAIPLVRV